MANMEQRLGLLREGGWLFYGLSDENTQGEIQEMFSTLCTSRPAHQQLSFCAETAHQ
jgi:hypothetical protein